MKIQLPDGKGKYLDNNISLEDKLNIVEELIEEWNHAIRLNWESNSVRFFLNGLANYLVWHKETEDKGKEDKLVLSMRKIEEMIGERKSRSIPFTYLSKSQKERIGLEDENYEQY